MRAFLTKMLFLILAPSTATRRQRQALGTVVLIGVILMAVLGSFYLRAGARPGTSLLFWGICFLLMLWAVFLAYLEVKSIKEEFRSLEREIFLSTFSKAHFKKRGHEKNPASREAASRRCRQPPRKRDQPQPER